jgi:ribosome-binding protein aMBF1 (putative translation factor)
VEGPSDERYLSKLIHKQLSASVARAERAVRVVDCEICSRCITGTGDSAEVDEALRDLALDCQLLFVHSDHKERAKAHARIEALRAGTQSLKQHRRAEPVAIITVTMVESWMLADRAAIKRAIVSADLSKYPYKNPADVEKAHNDPQHPLYAKKVWQSLVGTGREAIVADAAEALVEHTDLRTLAQLPSYQQWLSDTEAALKLKGFL